MSSTTTTETQQQSHDGQATTVVGTLPTVAGGAAQDALAGYDEEQIRLMEERCIVVSNDDEPLRDGSKKECHLMTNIEKGLLHRAFSVFLFDPVTGKLLLQRRATEKITFPDMWTNTCCSHPLAIKGELEEAQQIGEFFVRVMAMRPSLIRASSSSRRATCCSAKARTRARHPTGTSASGRVSIPDPHSLSGAE